MSDGHIIIGHGVDGTYPSQHSAPHRREINLWSGVWLMEGLPPVTLCVQTAIIKGERLQIGSHCSHIYVLTT